jgi:hypothetical protein
VIYHTRRAMYRAAADYVRRQYPYRVTVPAARAISASLTRDECLHEARMLLDELRWKRRDPIRQLRGYEARGLLFAAEAYRREAARRDPLAPGRAFYVTIRQGEKRGFLYGPFASQIAALREVRTTKALALELNHSDAAFASFGTASLPIELARPGLLNDRLPPIASAPKARGCIAA